MFPAASQLVPLTVKFCRQIVPPVVATLIAAGLISAYNHTFSGHLSQPRMSALHAEESAPVAPITTVGMTRRPAPPAAPVTETITIYEEVIAPERLADKSASEATGKDQTVRLAEPAPAPAPVRTAAPAPRAEPKFEPRIEPHRVAAVELPQPVVRAPAPVIAAAPPPVIVAAPPIVTVPDRANARPVEEAQVQSPPAPPRDAFGTFVHVMKPSTWFARAREFGQKIEDVGNEILPSIRQ